MRKEIGDYNDVGDEISSNLNIPKIPFKKNWKVTVIEPFAGAVFRFVVRCCRGTISVYLDRHEKLGWYGSPYWEIYPYFSDTYRCDEADVDNLVTRIEASLYHLNNEDTKSYIEEKIVAYIENINGHNI